jgi:hypothetical protein
MADGYDILRPHLKAYKIIEETLWIPSNIF